MIHTYKYKIKFYFSNNKKKKFLCSMKELTNTKYIALIFTTFIYLKIIGIIHNKTI